MYLYDTTHFIIQMRTHSLNGYNEKKKTHIHNLNHTHHNNTSCKHIGFIYYNYSEVIELMKQKTHRNSLGSSE